MASQRMQHSTVHSTYSAQQNYYKYDFKKCASFWHNSRGIIRVLKKTIFGSSPCQKFQLFASDKQHCSTKNKMSTTMVLLNILPCPCLHLGDFGCFPPSFWQILIVSALCHFYFWTAMIIGNMLRSIYCNSSSVLYCSQVTTRCLTGQKWTGGEGGVRRGPSELS